MFYLYYIENTVNDSLHFIKSITRIDDGARWSERRRDAGKNHAKMPIHHVMNKYSEDKFAFNVMNDARKAKSVSKARKLKLSEEQRQEIRDLHMTRNHTQKELATMYGVNINMISSIVNNVIASRKAG